MTAVASILPNGRKQFFDANGNPLAGGSVSYYIPATTALKTTWQDPNQVTPNTNPVVLDAVGSALVYGSGSYREYVTDALGNLIQDALTADLSAALTAYEAALASEIAPTGASLIGYLSPVTGAQGTTVQAKLAQSVSALEFGVDPTGATDSTAALQAYFNYCFSSGAKATLPAGNFLVSSTLTLNNTVKSFYLQGAGTRSTVIKTNSATVDVFDITAFNCRVTDLTITSTVARTAGNHILSVCTNSAFERLVIDSYYYGINGQDGYGTMRDIIFSGAVANAGVGLYVNGYGAGLVVDGCLWGYNTGQPLAGMIIEACGSLLMTNSDCIEQGNGMIIQPTSGVVQGLQFTNCQWDTSANAGISINPSGTGVVRQATFTNCWIATSTTNNVVLSTASSGSSVSNISFNGCFVVNCQDGNGLVIGATGVTHVKVNGGTFAANAGGSGIAVSPGCTDFDIIGVTTGSAGGFAGNSQWGVLVEAGASDRYVISLNRTYGDATGGVSDGGTGSDKFVGNNIT